LYAHADPVPKSPGFIAAIPNPLIAAAKVPQDPGKQDPLDESVREQYQVAIVFRPPEGGGGGLLGGGDGFLGGGFFGGGFFGAGGAFFPVQGPALHPVPQNDAPVPQYPHLLQH